MLEVVVYTMMELIIGVNWLAVLVGMALSYILGALWYSRMLFGKKWAQGVGVTLDEGDKPSTAALIVQAVGVFLLAWAVGVTAVANSPVVVVIFVLAFAVLTIASGLFSRKSAYAIATEAGFIVAMAVVMIMAQQILWV